MRINSPKQTQASRENGATSKGVKSPGGKNRIRLNALKDGLFSKDLVIESVGERKADFERLKKEMWDLFQPASALEEILVADIVENWWHRQRVRRAESADLRNRLDTSSIRDKLRRYDEIEPLKATFFDLLRNYVMAFKVTAASVPKRDHGKNGRSSAATGWDISRRRVLDWADERCGLRGAGERRVDFERVECPACGERFAPLTRRCGLPGGIIGSRPNRK